MPYPLLSRRAVIEKGDFLWDLLTEGDDGFSSRRYIYALTALTISRSQSEVEKNLVKIPLRDLSLTPS